MKGKKILVFLIACVCSLWLHAQVTYLWVPISDGGFGTDRYEMHEIDFLGGVSLGVVFSIKESRFEHPSMTGVDMRINSFEFTRDMSQVYFMEFEGDLYRYTISTDELEYLGDMTPETSPFPLVFGYTQINDLIFINDTIIYMGGFTHGIFNVKQNTFLKLREPMSHAIAITLTEQEIDITRIVRHRNEYIYISAPGSQTLRLADLSNPENSVELFDFKSFNLKASHEQIISYQYDCDSTILYVGATENGNNGRRGFWKVDLDNRTIEFFRPWINIPGGILFSVVKHYNKTDWEDCQRRIDLDKDDSTIGGVDFLIDSLCSFDQMPLSDLDIKINNEYPIDSIIIEIIDPRFSQYLNFPSGNYTLADPPNPWQRIINNGNTSLADFEDAIRNAYLFIDNDPDVTEVQIRFTVWYDGVAGTEAIATLRLANPLPRAGDDIEREFCEGDPTLTLENILAPNADEGGSFYDSDLNLISDLPTYQAPFSDSLYYVVTNGICYDTSQIINIINPNPESSPLPDTMLCHNDILNIDLSTYDENLTWVDGATDKVRQIGLSGVYSYTLSNIYGCSARDTFEVIFLPPTQTMPIDAIVCEGEIFTFQNQTYTVPGNYRDTVFSQLGCDSIIYTIDFQYYPIDPLKLEGNLGFCEGEKTQISIVSNHTGLLLDDEAIETPFSISEEGVYLLSGYDSNGCYTELELPIETYPNPIIYTMDLLDTLFSIGLKLPVKYEGNISSYRWSPASGLDCDGCPYPQLTISQDGSYDISVIDENGCAANGRIMVTFKKSDVFLSNVISNHPSIPENGVLYLQGSGVTQYEMQVYDRWGNKLYDKRNLKINDSSMGWSPDGRYNPGVYVYMITYEDNGEKKVIVGDITVL